MDPLTRAVEAALFAATEPMTVAQLSKHLGDADVRATLAELAQHYAGRGVELVERGGRWHFQTAPDLAHLLRREREDVRRLSRAGTEVLAIVAYHEPVSRAVKQSAIPQTRCKTSPDSPPPVPPRNPLAFGLKDPGPPHPNRPAPASGSPA